MAFYILVSLFFLSCMKINQIYGECEADLAAKHPCPAGQRDDGTSCWLDSYGRGVGRIPDKTPCPSGLRDDGSSCWNDAHVYGKGCCCTLWGCCHKCRSGYHDDGCTCRKTGVGIKVSLMQRQYCKSNEDKYGALCYPKCKQGFHNVGCCICEPTGGPRVTKAYKDRLFCKETAYNITALGICFTGNCPFLDLLGILQKLGLTLSSQEENELRKSLADIGKLL